MTQGIKWIIFASRIDRGKSKIKDDNHNQSHIYRSRVNRDVQTVNWEAGKEGAAETGVKPWMREALNREAQTVN